MARTRFMLDKKGYTHAVHAHAHAPGLPHTRARAHTHKYVILIAFSPQQWFCERVPMLRYTYIDSVVGTTITLLTMTGFYISVQN